MKKGHGKNKGNAFEREVCKLFSHWAGGNGDTLFWRTASSGGRFTQHSKRGKGRQAGMDGDITSVDSRGEFFTKQFHIECKSYKDADLLHLLDLPNGGDVMAWWKQAWFGALATKKFPLLIFKRNRSKIYVAQHSDASLGGDDVRITVHVPVKIPGTKQRIVTSIDIYHIEDWLRNNSSKAMREAWAEQR